MVVSLRTFLTRFTAVTALVPAAALGLQAPSQAASATAPTARVTPTSATAGIWRPPVDSRWQYQLQGSKTYASTGGVNVDICGVPQGGGACVRPSVFDIDLYAAEEVAGNNTTLNTAAVKAIHAKGAKAICYVDAGSIEEFRPDYQKFVDWHNAHGKSLLGKPFSEEFPNERWANINNDKGQRDFLLQMMAARVDKCAQAGFDGVEFDVVNAHEEGKSVTGWTVSPATQLTYNRALAAIAHGKGLSVALKNDLSQAEELVSSFDYAVNEECFQFDECSELNVFVKAGKPVFHVEYATAPSSFCAKSRTLKFNSLKKPEDYSLYDKPYAPCR
ncbi:endo alpha-1,4 polygalactosaminidase [Nonomuraea rhodomycinica]|uniref:Endo alpha-1,4 polygalactosaminidase n=1 Tax=Nonomuraea rhodomycinica TaxID=1712872 RepID=A0A7Y6IL90_9ACTN|nr:endo alpha-1,4 polygalactosaminidase [Nonomuraea rhodomycinica]NUW40226.1 endo alpha-1,4 polygalactosaminidase [Nonomuraea rhodomycinica]